MGSIVLDFGAAQTLTTTAAQDNRLARLLADVNAERARQSLPALTLEQYLRSVLVSTIQSYVAQANARDAADACAAYHALSAADQQLVRDKLGGKSPCP